MLFSCFILKKNFEKVFLLCILLYIVIILITRGGGLFSFVLVLEVPEFAYNFIFLTDEI